MLTKCDFIMCDMKHMDSPTHKKWTGLDNQLIINNIGRASLLGIPMIVRTPLIPGVTDSTDNIRQIGEYMAKLQNIVCYELLNYNPLGSSKKTALDKPDEFEDTKPLSKQELDELKAGLGQLGLTLKIS